MENKELNLAKLIIIGDRVLVRPRNQSEKTASGLFLPPGVLEKERIQSGYVMKVGPGYPIPLPPEGQEPWKEPQDEIKYIPLQIKEGDLAIFLQKDAYEVIFEGDKYFIVPQNSILMVERDEDLFD
ncbi:MAG: co-chaperone GroES family protein [Bacteroidia bacterium]|nr:co-chaperone GroES family protein [Bacteroidia bacterium]